MVYLFYFLCLWGFYSTSASDDVFPRAQNLTWKSTNFKTFLTWEPEPSEDCSYTVEFSVSGGNKQRNPHCIRSPRTQCDLSGHMSDLQSCYSADVLSEPLLGAKSDLLEFPHTTSPPFCPYQDTDIGRPNFKLEVSADKRKTILYVTDPLTAVFQDGRQLTIRDIYADQLQYKVTYRRNKSTGKKVHFSKSNVVELSDLDRGQSYCFNVQAYIPNRTYDKQLGELSHTQCSEDQDQSLLDVYSVGVIAAGVFLILLIGIAVAVAVVCCNRRKKALEKEKEGIPLQRV